MRDVATHQVGGIVCRRREGGGIFGPFFNQCISSGVQAAEMSSVENIPRCAIRCLGKHPATPDTAGDFRCSSTRRCCSWWIAVWERLVCVFYPIAGNSIICCPHLHVTLALEFGCVLQTSHSRLVSAA